MLDAINYVTDETFFFQEDSALVHMHYARNTVQLLRRCRLSFSWTMPPSSPELNALITRFRDSFSCVWVVSQKDWRNRGAIGWILAMHWYSIWVKNAIFVFPRFAR